MPEFHFNFAICNVAFLKVAAQDDCHIKCTQGRVILPSISIYGFADGYTPNKRFNPSSTHGKTYAIREIETCAVIINNWMNANKL